jgi:hypothetical protein
MVAAPPPWLPWAAIQPSLCRPAAGHTTGSSTAGSRKPLHGYVCAIRKGLSERGSVQVLVLLAAAAEDVDFCGHVQQGAWVLVGHRHSGQWVGQVPLASCSDSAVVDCRCSQVGCPAVGAAPAWSSCCRLWAGVSNGRTERVEADGEIGMP